MAAKLKAFWTDNALFGGATLAAGLFNYLYHVALAHVLGPQRYGDLATFLNVTSFLVIPASVVMLLYTRIGRRGRPEAIGESWWLWGGGFALWAALSLAAGTLGRSLAVSPVLLVIFTAEVAPSIALAANLGMLQRSRRYILVGMLGMVNTGFRVIAAAGALWLGYRLAAVGVLEGLAAWVTWFLSRGMVRRISLGSAPSESARIVFGTAMVGIINVLFAVVDGLAAKYVLRPEAAGQYNGLATMGHSLQFLSASMSTVMLTAMLADESRRYQYLVMTGAAYSVLAAMGEWSFYAYGHMLVYAVLGPEFLEIVRWIPYYGWGMISLGFLNIALLYSVARNRWEVIMTSGLGLIYWTWALVHDHTFAAFVMTTTHIMVTTLIATTGVLVLGQLVAQHIKVRPDPS